MYLGLLGDALEGPCTGGLLGFFLGTSMGNEV